MSKAEKAKARLKSIPKDFTYSEAKTLLKYLGYKEFTKGATSGSRVKFYRESDKAMILLHKPHPGDIMDTGATAFLKEYLEGRGEI